MKAIIKIKSDNGRYFATATGDKVTKRELELEFCADISTMEYDYFRAKGSAGNRYLKIPASELAWLCDGKEREYPYELEEVEYRED